MKYKQNIEEISGRVYQHDLSLKKVQNEQSKNYGTEFISGTIEIAVDEELLNIIPVHFTYVIEKTASGKINFTYKVLNQIMNENKTVLNCGKDEATKVRVNTSLALNDFYTQDGQLVSVKANEGGFVSIINTLPPEKERNVFTFDMVITGTTFIDKDEEKGIEAPYLLVKGGIFNFREELLPIDLMLKRPDGIKYIENLEISNKEPLYVNLWGKICCETKTKIVEEESAFGEAAVKTYKKKTKEWIITGMATTPYDFGEEGILTADELTKAMQDRELMLADIKKRSEEYRVQKAAGSNSTTNTSATTNIKHGTFNF